MAAASTARRRLLLDLKSLQKDAPVGVNATPMEGNLMAWQAIILGPDDTPWEGGTFHLLLDFTEEYPNKPPNVRFVTKVYHPNVYADGKICLDILQSNWTPIYNVASVLQSIQCLLTDPNPASPANSEAAKLFEENREEYHKKVRACVEASWVEGDLGGDSGSDSGSGSGSDSDSSDEDEDGDKTLAASAAAAPGT